MFRAITADALVAAGRPSEGKTEADKAVEWFRKAVDAGYQERGDVEHEEAFAVLRNREDFKKLLDSMAGMETKAAKP